MPRENLLSPAVPRENLLSPQSQNNFFRINVEKIDFDERNLAIIIKIPIPFYFSHILVYNYLQTYEKGLNRFSRGALDIWKPQLDHKPRDEWWTTLESVQAVQDRSDPQNLSHHYKSSYVCQI